jgi:hypothetical protein
MSNKINCLSLVIGLGLATGAVWVAPPQAYADDSSSRAADLKSYDFEDDLVQGDLINPDGEPLFVRRRGTRESLIRVRTEYVPELLKSAEDL